MCGKTTKISNLCSIGNDFLFNCFLFCISSYANTHSTLIPKLMHLSVKLKPLKCFLYIPSKKKGHDIMSMSLCV